jgi:16S rRNA (adenine1518-N6/adenine1519-N6)-dimethyltransferase
VGRPYGQHFLKDPSVVHSIVDACRPSPGEQLIEVGAGRGALTWPLLELGAPLTAVEIDPRLCEGLRAGLGGRPGFRLIEGDFLAVPEEALGPGPFVFVGNLPYDAAGPILRRIVRWPGWRRAVVMVQKEVADRLLAAPGVKAFGPLTVETALWAEVERAFDVPPDAFTPPPKVESSVVRLWPRRLDLGGKTSDEIMKVVHAAFQQRRKKVANSLASALGLEKTRVETALTEAGLDPSQRAETISVEAYVRLARRI